MSEEEKRYLVCVRIIEGRSPPVVSTRTKCGQCHKPVWRANSSPRPNEIEILCVECALEMAEGKDIEIMPPTREQIESIASVLRRRNN
jgi:hypothetical protein